jgi:hypothetical protein
MFTGADFLMKRSIIIFTLGFLFFSSFALAQTQATPEKRGIYAVVKDVTGETAEGFLRLGSDELTVQTKENQEETVPVKYIKSITLEKTPDSVPGGDPKRGVTYSVRLENSQEIYTLSKKYTFSLNTSLGMVTRTIDPDQVNKLFSKDPLSGSGAGDGKSFIQDQSVIFSLEFKF